MLNSGLASAAEASIIAAKMQIPVIAINCYLKSIDAPAPAASKWHHYSLNDEQKPFRWITWLWEARLLAAH